MINDDFVKRRKDMDKFITFVHQINEWQLDFKSNVFLIKQAELDFECVNTLKFENSSFICRVYFCNSIPAQFLYFLEEKTSKIYVISTHYYNCSLNSFYAYLDGFIDADFLNCNVIICIFEGFIKNTLLPNIVYPNSSPEHVLYHLSKNSKEDKNNEH